MLSGAEDVLATSTSPLSEVNQMSNTAEITIRRLDHTADAAVLARLAGKDTRPAPHGNALGAFVDGELLAAISLASGRVIADPFKPTSELRKLLKLRAGQMHGEHIRRRTGLRRRRELVAL
jgi:hypothetical protein